MVKHLDVKIAIDTSEVDSAIVTMEKTAPESMGKSISDVLQKQIPPTKMYLKGKVPSSQRTMAKIVGESLVVEQTLGGDTATVRFGSHPIDDGGVESKNGGKLAQYLQNGVDKFSYGFRFKTISNTAYFGGGTGFINARTPARSLHPGFKSLDYIGMARDEAIGEIEMALISGFNQSWGG
tara:strand:+ start:287 stop:826 length:540 start_codon:yes stop_codon:yes gene_type:complete